VIRRLREEIRWLREEWPRWSDVLDAVDRYVQRVHGPYDVLGDQSVAICWHCEVEWPCQEFLAAQDRMDTRFEERL
jgi:hypothetical protein